MVRLAARAIGEELLHGSRCCARRAARARGIVGRSADLDFARLCDEALQDSSYHGSSTKMRERAQQSWPVLSKTAMGDDAAAF